MTREICGVAAGAVPIVPAAEKAVLEKLDIVASGSLHILSSAEARTLKAKLVERENNALKLGEEIKALRAEPRLPAEPTNAMLAAMADSKSTSMEARYAALYAHLAKPAAKTVEVWRVEWAEWADAFSKWLCLGDNFNCEKNARDRAKDWLEGHPRARCIHVTGPHKQEVPT